MDPIYIVSKFGTERGTDFWSEPNVVWRIKENASAQRVLHLQAVNGSKRASLTYEALVYGLERDLVDITLTGPPYPTWFFKYSWN
jgi:hypothetical protein